MRKVLLLIATCVSVWSYSAIRSQYEAAELAAQFMNAVVDNSSHSGRKKCMPSRLDCVERQPAYYVFNLKDFEGFVIVSADDNARTILGYSLVGSFSEERIPKNMRFWLSHLSEEILSVNERLAFPSSANYATTPIDPLLDKDNIQWNQGSPFNDQCPVLGNQHCVTGCVPTAFGQVMRYWKYPSKGVGSTSYVWNEGNLQSDFSKHSYDWNNMLGTYTESATTTQKSAVALLLSDVGIAAHVSYGLEASSASIIDAVMGMVKYFDYDPELRIANAEYMGQEEFEKTILAELEASRPVVFSGRTISGEGHAFVCDGVDANGLYHINWGWGGYCNGNFVLSALNPKGQGIGGAAFGGGYDVSVMAIVNLKPNQHKTTSIPAQMYMKKFVMKSAMRVPRSAAISTAIGGMYNYGLSDWNGNVGVAICDKNRNFISWLSKMSGDLERNMYFISDVSIPSASISSSMKTGEYILMPMFTQTISDLDKPYRFDSRKANVSEYHLTLTNDSAIFSISESSPYISNMHARDNGNETMTFSWSAKTPAAKYVVVVESGGPVSRDTVTTLSATVRFYIKGNYSYSWTLYALDANDKIMDSADGDAFVMNVTSDYPPFNLKVSLTEASVIFTWQGYAPGYQIEVSNPNHELLLRQFTNETSYTWNYRPRQGVYYWNIRSTDQAFTSYVSEAVFSSFDASKTALEETQVHTLPVKYFKDGRLVIVVNGHEYDVMGYKYE